MASTRGSALERAGRLFERDSTRSIAGQRRARRTRTAAAPSAVRSLLKQAGCRCPAPFFPLACAACGCLFSIPLLQILSPVFIPLFFIFGASIPVFWLESQIQGRASEFARDYPTVLLAAASSLKTGATAAAALERAVKLLPKNSLAKNEVQTLTDRLKQGMPPEQAVREFGEDIALPDLALFRSAFLLVLENGGRFAPTLERLASVMKDRTSLIASAQVSTAVMRMTANILLIIAPCIVGIIAVRTENFWETFTNHSGANTLGTVGIALIAFSYLILKRMSCFKP